MSSSVSVAQESARGTLILLVGNILSTGITTVTVIFLARLLTPDGYGLYTLAFVVPGLLNQFVGFGVNAAVTRYVAFFVSKGEIERAKSVTRTATIFLFVTGALFSLGNFLLAPYLAGPLVHRPELVSAVQLTSLWVLGVSITSSSQSAFIGWSSMAESSGFTVLLAVLKLVLSVGLILAGFGVIGAILGHVGAYVVSGLAATTALLLQRMRPWNHGIAHFREDVGHMLRYGFPVFAGGIIGGIAGQYLLIVLASIANNSIVGYYQAAVNVTVAINVISGALSLVLFRSFAALHGLEEDIALAFRYSVKYTSFFLTPIAFFLLASATALVDLLYGPSYAASVLLLQIAAVAALPVAIGSLVLPSFFNGIGLSRLTLFISIVGAAFLAAGGFVFGVVLNLGAEGVMIANVASAIASTVAGLILSGSYLGTRLPGRSLLGIFVSGLVAFAATSLLPTDGLSSGEAILVEASVFFLLFLTLVPLLGGLDEDDFTRLSIAAETMGPVRRIFEVLLRYERRILAVRTRGRGTNAKVRTTGAPK